MSSFNTQHIQSAANPLVFFFTFQPMDVNFVSVENMTKFHSKNQEKRKTKKKKIVVLALNSWRLTFIHDPIANDYRYKREQVKKLKKKRLSILSIYPRVFVSMRKKMFITKSKKKKRKMKIPSGRTTDNKQNILLQGWWFFKSLQISSKKSCPCSLLTRRKRRIISFKQK